MEDPHLIATLILPDKFNYAENAFRCEENKRSLPPTRRRACHLQSGPMPAYDPQNNHEDTHRLLLTFNKKLKDLTKGYAFNTDQKYNVWLGPRGIGDISGVHFHITFGMIREKRCLKLRDTSTNVTAVSSDGQAKKTKRGITSPGF